MAIDSTDHESHPRTFQERWAPSSTDPSALPFPKDAPPFNLTAIDWHQLTLTDAEFTPHSWANLTQLIASHRLELLLRYPSALKAYLAWSAHVKQRYGSATNYLLQQRLHWTPLSSTGPLRFELASEVPFADARDFAILRNDWPYGLEAGITHVVVWLKKALPVDAEGGLTADGRKMVEDFVRERFREVVGEEQGKEGEKVLWFKNTTNLQSVRSLEHVHVLLRDVDDEVLRQWLN